MSDTTPENVNATAYLKMLKLLHLAIIVAPCLFGVFVVYSHESLQMDFNHPEDVFVYIVPLIALGGYFGSSFIFGKIIGGLRQKKNLQQKLSGYQGASLVKYALLEGPALLSFFAYMNVSHPLYLLIGVSLVVYLFFQRPSKDGIIKDLELGHAEQRYFKNL
ncbi:hypothetical protein [Spongiimicrobium salis]|uniref:hypothetical protein n=1 Tax=Spongiimicrobium salis TaxID=1667022 RepID=UPI00374DC139